MEALHRRLAVPFTAKGLRGARCEVGNMVSGTVALTGTSTYNVRNEVYIFDSLRKGIGPYT